MKASSRASQVQTPKKLGLLKRKNSFPGVHASKKNSPKKGKDFDAKNNQMDFSRLVQKGLYEKYQTAQNYFYSKPVNEILRKNPMSPSFIRFQDLECLLSSKEHFSQFYPLETSIKKLNNMVEYYKFHQEIPRLFLRSSLTEIALVHHDKKRQFCHKVVVSLLSNVPITIGSLTTHPKTLRRPDEFISWLKMDPEHAYNQAFWKRNQKAKQRHFGRAPSRHFFKDHALPSPHYVMGMLKTSKEVPGFVLKQTRKFKEESKNDSVSRTVWNLREKLDEIVNGSRIESYIMDEELNPGHPAGFAKFIESQEPELSVLGEFFKKETGKREPGALEKKPIRIIKTDKMGFRNDSRDRSKRRQSDSSLPTHYTFIKDHEGSGVHSHFQKQEKTQKHFVSFKSTNASSLLFNSGTGHKNSFKTIESSSNAHSNSSQNVSEAQVGKNPKERRMSLAREEKNDCLRERIVSGSCFSQKPPISLKTRNSMGSKATEQKTIGAPIAKCPKKEKISSFGTTSREIREMMNREALKRTILSRKSSLASKK